MGLVFRAQQARPERIVALKVIAPELASNEAFRARFEQESAVAAQIEHPNVIPVYEVGEDRGIVFIAMRFVDGVNLGELRRRSGRLEPAHATRLIGQVASALDAAHARGLVHRDVKPGNMLVSGTDPEEHIYLTDFGLTKRNDESRGLTASGMYVGTLDYIAPEQVTGERVGAATDVYSLGCVLYELLSGSVPFPRETDVAKVFAHVSGQAQPLRELVPEVPPRLSRVVEQAMSKDPSDRHGSAGAFAREARQAAVETLVGTPPRGIPTRPAAPIPKVVSQETVAKATKLKEGDGLAAAPKEDVPAVPAGVVPTAPAPRSSTPEKTSSPSRFSLPRRRLLVAVLGSAVIAIATIAIALAPGSGRVAGAKVADPQRDPLTATQLSHALKLRAVPIVSPRAPSRPRHRTASPSRPRKRAAAPSASAARPAISETVAAPPPSQPVRETPPATTPSTPKPETPEKFVSKPE